MTEVASFTRISEATPQDWDLIMRLEKEAFSNMGARLLKQLKVLDDPEENYGLPVTRYEHSLQTATRAFQAGESDEMVVAALLHDVGEVIAPHNHDDAAGAILKPFLSERACWVVQNHAIFQGYYYWHHLGLDRNARDKWLGHPHFEATARFCEKFDEPSFDPGFKSMPIEAFQPIVERITSQPWALRK